MWQLDQVTLKLFIAGCDEGAIARAAERESMGYDTGIDLERLNASRGLLEHALPASRFTAISRVQAVRAVR